MRSWPPWSLTSRLRTLEVPLLTASARHRTPVALFHDELAV
jgi:hypothetical protein